MRTMKVTGIQLREAIKRWALRRDTASTHFAESLWQFKEDENRLSSPQELADQYQAAERAIATLQTAQARYNLAAAVDLRGESLTLCDLVKRLGGAGRIEKMWRSATRAKGHDRYSGPERSRSKDAIQATRMVSIQDALGFATQSARYAGDLRNAIALANTNQIEIEDLDPALFE